MNKMRFSGSAVFGIILIAVGAVSLMGSLNYFDSWDVFSTFWPLLLVLFGVKHMIDHRSSTIFGVILIGVGAFLQLEELNLWYLGDIYVRELIIPTVIILIGLYFVLPRKREDKTVVTVKASEATTEVKVTKTEEPMMEEATIASEVQALNEDLNTMETAATEEAVTDEVEASQEESDARFAD